MAELWGEVGGEMAGVRVVHVGAFPDPRVRGHPAAWTSLHGPGPFRMEVPPGLWYVHAVGGPTDGEGFLSGTVWGSHGGIYGFGTPVEAGGPAAPPPLRIHLSPLWRDLTHVPQFRQPALSDSQWRAVRSVIQALGENLASTVDGDLGRAAGLVRTRLSALFKRATGLTMEEYRTRLRLEAAKALLAGTDSDVLHIALEVGYGSPAQLGRMFQRYLGVTPGEFRRLAREVGGCGEPGGDGEPRRGPAARPSSASTLGDLLRRALPVLTRQGGATVRGEVVYRGARSGPVIYVGAFPRAFPDTYPSAWCAIPSPGPFTLRAVPAGRHHILACYCFRRMLFPGDFYTAFAYAGYGAIDTTGHDPWEPSTLELRDGDSVGGIMLEMVDGDRAARYARPWIDFFLPDGR